MPETTEEIEAAIRAAVQPEFRDGLLALGQSRSMIWRNGILPPDVAEFSAILTYDLLSYGFSLLDHGLRLLDGEGDGATAIEAFEHAASAIEAVAARGAHTAESGFHRLIAGAAYHLGGYSARAYSLLQVSLDDANMSESEACLARLMLRDLNAMDAQIVSWRLGGSASDDLLIGLLNEHLVTEHGSDADEPNDLAFDALDLALTDNYLAAMATAMLGFERGESELIDAAVAKLRVGLDGCADLNLVPQWWCHRLTIYLLRDLWVASFYQRLPPLPPDSSMPGWVALRETFISSLYTRGRAEIELWPSQLSAAARVLDQTDNMVVSLPTSSGKTRIAELCILACLASGRRVVFITPLRALSAQTETSLLRTFQPLGKSISSLYGSIGISSLDEGLMRNRDIIVGTPEKLDFALRNDPSLLDDVGLVILDEGHMIGLGEREVRYEVQIQRLLRRSDAFSRRIVCLSAILPEGEQLQDFVAWLCRDNPDGLQTNKWRPTRLRFGELVWEDTNAALNIEVRDEKPSVPKFVSAAKPPIGARRKLFPADQRELCLAAAWRLVEDGQTVLIFCPERRSVEPFAKAIVDLNARGALASIAIPDHGVLAAALAIGLEWFSPKHPVLQCLKLGVAIHHGALPSPFRKEIEKLLREGVLKVTISSPTLAQGLNLSATTLIFHGVTRSGERIESSEFRNVVGRAGRAYIDLEGLVLYPMFDKIADRRRDWKKLVSDDAGREMESGLLRLLLTLISRMARKIGHHSVEPLTDYVLNNASAWKFSKLADETAKVATIEERSWEQYMTSLDTAILSLLGEQDIDDNEVEAKIDEVLASSLFERRLARRNEATKTILRVGLKARAKHIWVNSSAVQRRSYFLAGVSLETGHQLDAHASVLGLLLFQANSAILGGSSVNAIRAISEFAEVIFSISPFKPDDLPGNWKDILVAWLEGKPIAPVNAGGDEVLRFIEQTLTYSLPWGMEAVRVRGLAVGDPITDDLTMADVEMGLAVSAVETGSLNRSASLLMRAGFNARSAAIKAVEDSKAAFTTTVELRDWLNSDVVRKMEREDNWPSKETHDLWMVFTQGFKVGEKEAWQREIATIEVIWSKGYSPVPSMPVRVFNDASNKSLVLSAECDLIATTSLKFNGDRRGLLKANITADGKAVMLHYLGPKDLFVQ